MRFHLVLLLGILSLGLNAMAEKIEFPTDELQQETVLPKFDDPAVVRNRSVNLHQRFEVGGLFGGTFNYPFYNVLNFGAVGTYHLDEFNAVQLYISAMSASSDQFATQLAGSGFSYYFDKLPAPSMVILGAYEITPYYGKLSVGKQAVANLTTSVSGGLGAIRIGSNMNPALSLGVDQRFFLSNKWGFSMDLRTLFYMGPRPSMANNRGGNGSEPRESSLSSTLTTNVILNGVVFFLL